MSEATSAKLALTIDEARALTGVGRNELYRACNAGELKVARFGRRMLIPTRELENWLHMRAGVVAVG